MLLAVADISKKGKIKGMERIMLQNTFLVIFLKVEGWGSLRMRKIRCVLTSMKQTAYVYLLPEPS